MIRLAVRVELLFIALVIVLVGAFAAIYYFQQ